MLLVVFLSATSSYSQQTERVGKSVFRVNTKGLSLRVPDSLQKQLGPSGNGLVIPLGTVIYSSYYKDGFSKTDVAFEAGAGLRGAIDAKPVSVFSRLQDSSLFLFEEDILKEGYRYKFPMLTDVNEKRVINGYNCRRYDFIGSGGLNGSIWFSQEIPFWSSPGVYFKRMGGIVKIEYTFNDTKWDIELISHETINTQIDFKKHLPKSEGHPDLHFLFKKT